MAQHRERLDAMGSDDRESAAATARFGDDGGGEHSQLQLSMLLSNLPGIAYRCAIEPDWPMEFISDGVRELTGYTPRELMRGGGVEFGKLIHPDDRQPVWEQISEAVGRGERFEVNYRIITADGTKKWVWERGQAVCEEGVAVAIEGFITDVSEDHASVESLRKSEERFRLLSRATSDAIWDLDLANETLWWGDGFSELFGGRSNPSLEDWSKRLHPDDKERTEKSLYQALEGDASDWTAEYRFQRADGTYAHVLDRGHIIRDAGGTALRMVGGMNDISERKRLESRLLHNQKMESIGQLAGGLAHDFNNLLSVILCAADMGLATVDKGEMLYEDLVDMRAAAQRAAELTRQLLAFGRRQVLDPTELDANQVVGQMLGMLRRLLHETITVEFDTAPDLDHIFIDRGQLEQVLVNLVVNARDAMPDGGTLSITTENVLLDQAAAEERGLAEAGPHVLLQVRDTGVGMDEATCERIFEPFFTTKAPGDGTGFGLSTVHGIVEQSGGSIWVKSSPGEGATFSICFPASNEAPRPTEPEVSEPQVSGDETILVVEDDAAARRMTARVLRRAGYTVLLADHGASALEVLEDHADSVALMLTDVVMPYMGGPGLVERVSKLYPDIKVIYMTGYAGDAASLPGVAADARVVSKPVGAAELARVIRETLDA